MRKKRKSCGKVPAAERAFSDPLPERLYLDTDFLIAGLIDGEPHHVQSRLLLDRAAAAGTMLYLSSLSWMEFINVIIKDRFRVRLSEDVQRRLQLRRWQNARVRRSYVEFMLGSFDDALAQFAWDEVALTPAIRRRAVEQIAVYDLRPQDAVHVASAFAAGCADFASFDEAFRRVDGLVLWNDLIHTDKPMRG